MTIRVAIDILNDLSKEFKAEQTSFDIEITEMKNLFPTPLKSYQYSLYNDEETPILEGEIHNHDERAGPMQLVRRVINNIKEV